MKPQIFYIIKTIALPKVMYFSGMAIKNGNALFSGQMRDSFLFFNLAESEKIEQTLTDQDFLIEIAATESSAVNFQTSVPKSNLTPVSDK